MPMYSGRDGQLLIDGVVAAKVQNWQFQSQQTMLSAQSFGDTDQVLIPDLRTLSGSAQLYYYQVTAGSGGDVTKLINKCIKGGSGSATAESQPVVLRLRIADGSTTGRYIELSAYLTGISLGVTVGEVVSAQVQFQADGAPTSVAL